MDFTTYQVMGLWQNDTTAGVLVYHKLCDQDVLSVLETGTTLSEVMTAATRHNARCPAIRREE